MRHVGCSQSACLGTDAGADAQARRVLKGALEGHSRHWPGVLNRQIDYRQPHHEQEDDEAITLYVCVEILAE